MKTSVSAIFAVTIFGATAPSASAHDWYPHECCHDKDCAPVESMTLITPAGGGAPYMVVASKHGKAILTSPSVPDEFRKLAEKDL